MYESPSVATVGVPTPGPSAWAAGARPARESAAMIAAPARRWDIRLSSSNCVCSAGGAKRSRRRTRAPYTRARKDTRPALVSGPGVLVLHERASAVGAARAMVRGGHAPQPEAAATEESDHDDP